MRRNGGNVVHDVALNWSGEDGFGEEAGARFDLAFFGGACSGEPLASCTSEGCEILP